MSSPLRLVVVDDHQVVREGLKALLEEQPDFAVIAEFDAADALLRALPQLAADLLILDLRLPDSVAAETVAEIKRQRPTLPVLVFTSYASDQEVVSVLEAGADGYLLKDALAADLNRALRRLADGQRCLDASAEQALIRARNRRHDPLARLTPREREVLQRLAEGASNREIASELGLTEPTVKSYLTQVYAKLEVRDRTQAALLALRQDAQ